MRLRFCGWCHLAVIAGAVTVVAALLILSSGCASVARPPVVSPPVVPSSATLTVTTTPGAAVTLVTAANPGGPSGTADQDGVWRTSVPSPGDYDVSAALTGYACREQHVTIAAGQADAAVVVPCDAVPTTPPVTQPSIQPWLDGRAIVDERGPRPRVGVSLFWGAWGWLHDRDRLGRNLDAAASGGADFVRVLAEVAGPSWSDRTICPHDDGYADALRGVTQMAMDRGMRVEWTLFGGGCYSSREEWLRSADVQIEALRPVIVGTMLIEITNERMLPDDAIVREIAARVRSSLGGIVTLSGTPEHELPSLYAGSQANLGVVHFDRANGDYGWRPMRQSWGYYDLAEMPRAWGNNEPIGIASSVRPESDPIKLASDAAVTFVAGGAYYVLHSGAGIYGREYDHSVGHRHANLWEQPTFESALRLVVQVRDAMPADIASWTRVNNHWTAPLPAPPFRFDQAVVGDGASLELGVCRAFTARHADGRFVTVALGARGDLVTTPTQDVEASVWDLSTGLERAWDGALRGSASTYLIHGRVK